MGYQVTSWCTLENVGVFDLKKQIVCTRTVCELHSGMVVFHTITHKNVHILLVWNVSFSKNLHSKTIFIPPALPSHKQ